MRTIKRSSAFKRDYKREIRSRYGSSLENVLIAVLTALANNQPLDLRYSDHDLSGDWAGYRECHLKPDPLLVYRKADASALRLARLGSHSE